MMCIYQSILFFVIIMKEVPTSRRPTAKPSCDSSATSAIAMNFGRGCSVFLTGALGRMWQLGLQVDI